MAAHCNNGTLDGDETGTDCGGLCETCADSETCVIDNDCFSASCSDELCLSASCADDGVMNGDEAGVDCGGSSCNSG